MPRMQSTPHIDPIPGTMKPGELISWRKGHGFSQADACALLGISRRTYQHYELGNTRGGFSLPRLPRIVELAIRGLDVELRVLKMRAGGLSLAEMKAEAVADEKPDRACADGQSLRRGDRAAGRRDDADGAARLAEVQGPHPA